MCPCRYAGPRAHINFNDGFLGGSTIEGNLLMNSCRESADHGERLRWRLLLQTAMSTHCCCCRASLGAR